MSGRRKRAETRHIIAFIVPRVSFSDWLLKTKRADPA